MREQSHSGTRNATSLWQTKFRSLLKSSNKKFRFSNGKLSQSRSIAVQTETQLFLRKWSKNLCLQRGVVLFCGKSRYECGPNKRMKCRGITQRELPSKDGLSEVWRQLRHKIWSINSGWGSSFWRVKPFLPRWWMASGAQSCLQIVWATWLLSSTIEWNNPHLKWFQIFLTVTTAAILRTKL